MKLSTIIRGLSISIALLFIALFLFINSPYLKSSIEWFINGYGGIDIEIGSISISRRIVVDDVIIKDLGGAVPRLRVKQVRLSLRPAELINNRSIASIELIKPDIFLDLTSGKGGEGVEQPFRVNHMVIHEGRVTIQTEARLLHISSINLTIDERFLGKTDIKGRLYLKELNTEIPLNMTIDLERMDVKGGDFKMSLRGIGTLTKGKIKGDLDLAIALSRRGGLMAIINTRYQDIEVHARGMPLNAGSGEMKVILKISPDYRDIEIQAQGQGTRLLRGKEDRYEIGLNGIYDIKRKSFRVNHASLNSSILGNLSLEGYLDNIPSDKVYLDLILKTGSLDLNKVADVFNMPERINAYVRSVFSIKGVIDSPFINGTVFLEGDSIEHRGIELRSLKAKIPVFYKKDFLDIKGASIKVDEAEFTGGDDHYLIKGGLEIYPQFNIIVPDGHIKGRIILNLLNGSLSTPDDSMAAEGLRMKANLDIEFSYPIDEIGFIITGTATDLELLVGDFYGDFGDKEIRLFFTGRYSKVMDFLNIKEAELSLSDMVDLSISGDISGIRGSPSINTRLKLTVLRSQKVYDLLIRDNLGDVFPFLSKLDISGNTSMEVSLKRSKAVTEINGEIDLGGMDIKGDGLSIEGVNLTLPVNISYPSVKVAKRLSYGSMMIKDLSIDDIRIKDILLYPAIWQNDLAFRDDIILPIFGGDIVLREVRYKDIINKDRELSFSVDIKGIDLQKLTETLGVQRFGGSISGSIPMAKLSHNNLSTDGEVIVHAFGGEMRIMNLSIDNLLSSIPSIRTSIELNDIDLGMLTDTFEFGQITGVLNGYVKSLVITNGEVEKFEISLETVKKKGGSQWISVKALKKISILGSGGSTSILDRGIYRFFKRYRYEKMGFKGELRNDNMTLHGIIKKGDKEYIVKGGLFPPRVDVISYTQNISFKELVRRLKRIKEVK
jgi:hypothetical protein